MENTNTNSTQPSQPVSFDAPLQQPTNITLAAPSGITFDDPLTTSTSVSVPQGQQTTIPSSNGSQPPPQAPQTAPTAQYSLLPTPQPTSIGGKLQRWAENVSHDVEYGTDTTGVGSVLKALGAHGVYSGNSQGVGNFMASLPLGLLQAAKGAGEVAQPGIRLQSAGDVAGGLLNASTMPSMFVAPEVGEVAGAGLDNAGSAIARQASRAAKAVTSPFDASTIQPELQAGIRSTINAAAKELGVNPSNAASIRDVATDVAAQVKGKAQSLYKTLDQASQGRIQRFDDALTDIQSQLRDVIDGENPDHEGQLIERLNAVQDAKDKVFAQMTAAGVDPGLLNTANALFKRGSAIEDLGQHIRASVSGMRPELAGTGKATSTPETVSTAKLFSRANSLYNRGRLQQALGRDKAQQLLQSVDAAHLQALKIQNAQQWLKTAAKIGAGAAGGYGAYSLVNHALGN